MPIKEQEAWLKNLAIVGDKNSERIVDKDLRRKYRERFILFTKEKYARQVTKLLKDYVQFCIPAARRGEVSFWAVSCLPQQNVYARINIYWQEVLTLMVYEEKLWLSLHLAKSPLESRKKLLSDFPSLEFYDHKYQPGGSDQVKIEILAEYFPKLIQDKRILPAIRLFNLRLMKKGPSTWGRNHCLNLADKLV